MGRPIRRAAVWGVLALALAVAVASVAWAATPREAGVQAHLLWANVSDAEMGRQLDQARSAGARVVRVDVGWQTLEERGKGRYTPDYLAKLDRLVAGARHRELDLLLTFVFTPCWASTAPDSLRRGCSGDWAGRGVGRYPPRDPGDYASALAFLAGRYGDGVRAWEVWNEPNSRAFFNTGDPVGRYSELLGAAYRAVKGAHAGATVVGGALSESDAAFADALYARGARDNMDVLSIHPYSHDRSPLDPLEPRYASSSFIRGVPAVRQVMLRYGDTRSLWLTELGWSTSTRRGGAPYDNGVSKRTQARYLSEAFAQARRWDYVGPVIWYELVDRGGDPADLQSRFGLRHRGGPAKPSLEAFRRAAALR
jgi:hypothetical protein